MAYKKSYQAKQDNTEKQTYKVDYIDILKNLLTHRGEIAKCYSLFHDYSINNQFLLYKQFLEKGETPCPVGTFLFWKKLERKIKKGCRALYMVQPKQYKYTETKTNLQGQEEEIEKQGIFFNVRRQWFSVNDTEGKDINLQLESPVLSLSNILKNLKITREDYAGIDGNTQGYCRVDSGNIAINPIAQNPRKTALHEIAHSLLHRDKSGGVLVDTKTLDLKCKKEIEAESTALICGTILGIYTEQEQNESIGYIKHWIDNMSGNISNSKVLKMTAKNIIKAVDMILQANKPKKQTA